MMTTEVVNPSEVSEFWRIARRLHAIYAELDHTFELGQPACADLEKPTDSSQPEAMERVREWFEAMDARTQVWQLRQLLQSTSLQNEENLRYLLRRHLDRKQRSESDKEKIDFLLVQYFAHCAPHGLNEQLLTLDDVAEVLQPVLGKLPEAYPEWAPGLDDKLQSLNDSNSLEELQNTGALLEVRELKLAIGDQYFDTGILVAFTRFNFRARRAFFKAMHLDLHAIRGEVNELEKMGYTTLDCREAGLSENESLDQVRHVVHQWKTPFRAPYSGGSSFLQLILLRHALRLKLKEAFARHAGQAGELLEGSEDPPVPVIVTPVSLAAPVVPIATKAKDSAPAHMEPVESHTPQAAPQVSAQAQAPHVASARNVEELQVGPVAHSADRDSGNVREIDLDHAHVEPELLGFEMQEPDVAGQASHHDAPVLMSFDEPPPSAPVSAAAPPPPPPPPAAVTIVQPAPQAVAIQHAASDPEEEHDDLQRCVADITAQLVSVPARNSPSVSAITLGGCKLLIATWEAEAFIFGVDDLSKALKRTVAARTILHVCLERHRKNEPTNIAAAMEIAKVQAEKMQASVADAKEQKNIDAAVNLAATNKRLLALIEEARALVG